MRSSGAGLAAAGRGSEPGDAAADGDQHPVAVGRDRRRRPSDRALTSLRRIPAMKRNPATTASRRPRLRGERLGLDAAADGRWRASVDGSKPASMTSWTYWPLLGVHRGRQEARVALRGGGRLRRSNWRDGLPMPKQPAGPGQPARLARRTPVRPRRGPAPAGRRGAGRGDRRREHRRQRGSASMRTEAAVPDGAADLVADLYRRLSEARITDILLEVDDATRFTEAFHAPANRGALPRPHRPAQRAARRGHQPRPAQDGRGHEHAWVLGVDAHCPRARGGRRLRPSVGRRRRGPGRAADGRLLGHGADRLQRRPVLPGRRPRRSSQPGQRPLRDRARRQGVLARFRPILPFHVATGFPFSVAISKPACAARHHRPRHLPPRRRRPLEATAPFRPRHGIGRPAAAQPLPGVDDVVRQPGGRPTCFRSNTPPHRRVEPFLRPPPRQLLSTSIQAAATTCRPMTWATLARERVTHVVGQRVVPRRSQDLAGSRSLATPEVSEEHRGDDDR